MVRKGIKMKEEIVKIINYVKNVTKEDKYHTELTDLHIKDLEKGYEEYSNNEIILRMVIKKYLSRIASEFFSSINNKNEHGNNEIAEKLFNKAAQIYPSNDTIFNLIVFYMCNDTKPNYILCYLWLKLINFDCEIPANDLNYIAAKLEMINKEYDMAFELYQEAYKKEKKDRNVIYNLAHCYFDGIGTDIDAKKACHFVEKILQYKDSLLKDDVDNVFKKYDEIIGK